jgi:hypothetical protein
MSGHALIRHALCTWLCCWNPTYNADICLALVLLGGLALSVPLAATFCSIAQTQTGYVDYDKLQEKAQEFRPKV